VRLVCSVGEVEAEDVHSRACEGEDGIRRGTGWTDGRDDFGTHEGLVAWKGSMGPVRAGPARSATALVEKRAGSR